MIAYQTGNINLICIYETYILLKYIIYKHNKPTLSIKMEVKSRFAQAQAQGNLKLYAGAVLQIQIQAESCDNDALYY